MTTPSSATDGRWPMCGPPLDHAAIGTCGRPGLALALHLTPCALRDGDFDE